MADDSTVIALSMVASRDSSTQVRKAAEDSLVQLFDDHNMNLSEKKGSLERIKTALVDINCKLDPGLSSLLGLTVA